MPSATEYFLTVFENRNPQRAIKAVLTSSEPSGAPTRVLSARLTTAVAVIRPAANEAERAVPEDVRLKRFSRRAESLECRLNEPFLVSRTLRDPKQGRQHL